MIDVSVNNESVCIEDQQCLGYALETWGYDSSKIAVAINNEFVPRSDYSSRHLEDGDQLDIVKPVGGG